MAWQQHEHEQRQVMRPRYLAILSEAILGDVDVTTLRNNWEPILRNGVFLKDKLLFYRLVGTSEGGYGDCYIILASTLTFSDQCDSWVKELETVPKPTRERGSEGLVKVEVPKLAKSVRWLEVKGSFSTVNLQLNTTYKVSFLVKVSKPDAFPKNGELPVELSLVLPSMSGRHEIINYETIYYYNNNSDWTEVVAGKFLHTYRTMGTMYFSMENTDATWKGGISVMGVYVKPETESGLKNILDWKPINI